MPKLTFDKERVSFNLARLKTHGQNFEIVVDPDLAVSFKERQSAGRPTDIDIRDILKSEEIFNDASQGKLAPEHLFKEIFNTEDVLGIALQILKKGEIQITAEHRAKVREQKKKKIIEIIHRNGIDPRSGLPHPIARLDSAIEQAKVKIDEFQKAEDQVNDVVHQLNPIIPIKFEKKKVLVKVFPEHAARIYGFFKRWNILTENWNSDGSLSVTVEIPAGLQNEFFDKLNSMTQGGNETKIL